MRVFRWGIRPRAGACPFPGEMPRFRLMVQRGCGLEPQWEKCSMSFEVLSGVIAGRMAVVSAAAVLGLSRRQVHRLLTLYRSGGAMALRHRARGRRSNRALSDGLRELALGHVRDSFADFGPTLAQHLGRERHGLTVSRETLRQWMISAGLWHSRKQRRQLHQPRLRRERLGELVQI